MSGFNQQQRMRMMYSGQQPQQQQPQQQQMQQQHMYPQNQMNKMQMQHMQPGMGPMGLRNQQPGPGMQPQPQMMQQQSQQQQQQQPMQPHQHMGQQANQGPITPGAGPSPTPTSLEVPTPQAGNPNSPSVNSPNPNQTQAAQQPPQQPKEINIATVCRIGQETVQEIVSRTQEVFSYLKSLQPPVGAPLQDKTTLEKQQRLQEVLNGITQLFKRLHVCWEKAHDHTAGMEYTQLESLIPIKDERDVKNELEKKRGESYKQASDEHNELIQQLTLKNRHLKDLIDQMRNVLWEINTMLAMR